MGVVGGVRLHGGRRRARQRRPGGHPADRAPDRHSRSVRRRRAVRRQPRAHRHRRPARRRPVDAHPGRATPRVDRPGTPRLRHHRVHHGRALGARRPRLGQRRSSSSRRSSSPSGPTRQYAEEVKGHERALDVLVAAVEAKAPHLVGHSARVAELSASMAEQPGAARPDGRRRPGRRDAARPRPDHPADRAGPQHRCRSAAGACEGYPARGVQAAAGLSFLSGALDAIAHHREAVSPDADAARGPEPAGPRRRPR